MKIAIVTCPHAIGWCYIEYNESKDDWLMRLPCPCNEKSTVLATFDALDLVRKLSPDGSTERGMHTDSI